MKDRILVTGGAGFIGSHLADLLLEEGYEVRALDNLDPQVHGPGAGRPDYLDPEIELIVGDVRDRRTVDRALEGCSRLVHFAAAVGVGQSMYEPEHYVSVNCSGTATVLKAAIEYGRLEKMLVASSMSIYGEGLYECPDCGPVTPGLRDEQQLAGRLWEPLCPSCGRECSPLPTSESKRLIPTSVYAVTKRDQEELFIAVGAAYGIPAVALRFFNVYGTRQALSNPYTGVGAIFASRLLNGEPPVIFEDGMQSRDFIHVSDIARAVLRSLESDASGVALNVGTGRATSIMEMAGALAAHMGRPLDFIVRNEFRAGDIRHCYADIALAGKTLGFSASVTLEEGVPDLVEWVSGQTSVDMVKQAVGELSDRGLVR
jgi:dTDP-L-rhamnose 4-epimerase